MTTLSDIVEHIHKNEGTTLTKAQIETATKLVFSNIADELSRGNEVRIDKFGTFALTERAAREGRNPATGATIQIAASTAVKFKASKNLKEVL